MPKVTQTCGPLTRFGRWLDSRTPADHRAPAIRRATGPTIEGVGLFRSFGSGEGKTVALNDVALELRQNELNLLMGPSGSGKSTLLAVLSALLRPDAGNVKGIRS